MNNLKKTKGFTLIELIIVIVILGILSVVAAPRFLDISSDARISALDGMIAAMQSALSLTVSYSQLKGLSNELNQDLTLPDGKVVRFDYGYPETDWETAWVNMLTGSFTLKSSGGNCNADTDWCVDSDFEISSDVTIPGATRATIFWLTGMNTAENCYIYYAYDASSKGNRPVIGKVISGC